MYVCVWCVYICLQVCQFTWHHVKMPHRVKCHTYTNYSWHGITTSAVCFIYGFCFSLHHCVMWLVSQFQCSMCVCVCPPPPTPPTPSPALSPPVIVLTNIHPSCTVEPTCSGHTRPVFLATIDMQVAAFKEVVLYKITATWDSCLKPWPLWTGSTQCTHSKELLCEQCWMWVQSASFQLTVGVSCFDTLT